MIVHSFSTSELPVLSASGSTSRDSASRVRYEVSRAVLLSARARLRTAARSRATDVEPPHELVMPSPHARQLVSGGRLPYRVPHLTSVV
jgi:hypothetical protein